MFRTAHRIAALLALIPVAWATAQDAAQPELPPQPDSPLTTENENWAPTWSDPVFAEIAGALSGSWKTNAPVSEFQGEGSTEFVLTFQPVWLEEMGDVLYVEAARADELHRPFHQAILQFWKRGDSVRLRTLEVKEDTRHGAMTGMWVFPAFFPQWRVTDLRGTLDMELTRDGNAWVGRSPLPYPTNERGAVEMTSQMRIAPGRLEVADRGFDMSGQQVWGPAAGESYTLLPFDHPFTGDMVSDGVWRVRMVGSSEGPGISEGDSVGFHYAGYLRASENPGFRFDTSMVPGRDALRFVAPGRLIVGWQEAIMGMHADEWYQLILRADKAYGGSPAARGAIPAWADLLFTINVQYVQPPVVEEPEAGADGGMDDEAADGD